MAVGEIARAGGPSPVLRVPALRPVPEWLELGQDDRTARFVGLTSDLSRAYDPFGDGKRITCGHAYTGFGSAVAWASACRDPLCGPPRQSIESFAERWCDVRAGAPVEPCHYVSLGPGDGRKDGVLLADLSRVNRDLCYLPVDASEELMHLAVRGLIQRLGLPADRVLSLPWDFSSRQNVQTIRRLLDELFGPTPVLVSLLGNTLANFDADAGVLAMLAAELLRPHDRLLLEVEVTDELTEGHAELAAAEHGRSRTFGEFAASALRHHVALPVDAGDIELLGGVERDRALVVKTVYRADEDAVLTLPNRASVRFALDDTIRLALSRKYSPEGLAAMIADAGLTIVADSCTSTDSPFGLALLMLSVA